MARSAAYEAWKKNKSESSSRSESQSESVVELAAPIEAKFKTSKSPGNPLE